MQRRDPRSFLEEVFAQLPDLDESTREALLEASADKAGTKRASRIAAILAQEAPADE